MNTTKPWVFDTDTGPDTLDRIQWLLDDFFAANPAVPELVRMHLGIAAAEVGANIVEHAASGRSVRMRMAVSRLPNEVRIDFTDEGVPAQIDIESVCLPEDTAERGRGLAIARSVLAELSYRRNAANHWTLISQRFDDPAPTIAGS